jgi:voltage-gated potassium channel Kch
MVTLKNALVTVVIVAVSLFIAANALTMYAGLKPLSAFFENLLGSLQVDYFILSPAMQDNPYALASDFIDGIVFALFTVVLAAWAFDFISKLGIRDRIILSRISQTKDHVIIAPFSPLAQELSRELKGAGIKTVFITENKDDAADIYEQNGLAVFGNANSTYVFDTAGIKRARCVVACSEDDLQNTMIIITAKNSNPGIKVISSVHNESDIPKLSMAGAYWMVKPEIAAGEKIADELLKRLV